MKFCFHDWGKWSDPLDTVNDYSKVQYRCCIKCNKGQVKKLSQPWNLWFNASVLKVTHDIKETH